ncbi:aspartate aminotransferase family protein [Micromonospora sp. DT4]|uniref:aminotransferase family protein n=1 Tax=Micromonospora sp. DT4 TaxID=3393438 RepID=UPI003CED103E
MMGLPTVPVLAGAVADPTELARLDDAYLWQPWSPVRRSEDAATIVAGDGCEVVDADGRRYLDARGGLFNATVGYGRPEVVEAMAAQARTLMTYGLGPASTPPAVLLAARLAGLFGEPLTRTFFCHSGSEATETAVKMARFYHALRGEPQRSTVLSLADGYHGSSLAGAALTRLPAVRAGVEPIPAGFASVATPRCAACAAGEAHPRCVVPGPEALQEVIVRLGPGRVAAFVVEPVLGVGGIVELPPGYLAAVRRVCDEHGVLLIVDEVMTGFGRTGAWFAHQADGVVPDIVTTAKGLAAGYAPLAAVTATQQIYQAFAADRVLGGFRHGYTTGGHAVAAAAALAVVQVIEDNDLVTHAAQVGRSLLQRLRAELPGPVVREVRGRGLLAGAQAGTERQAAEIVRECRRDGVLVRPQQTVVTLAPPLVLSREQADRVADSLAKAVRAVEARS